MFGEYKKKIVFDNTVCVKFEINLSRARIRVRWLDQAKSRVCRAKTMARGQTNLTGRTAKYDVVVTGRLKCCVGGLAGGQFGFPNDIIRKQEV